jgi:hypothetical protein
MKGKKISNVKKIKKYYYIKLKKPTNIKLKKSD